MPHGHKSGNSRLAQAPQNEETRSTATSFLESPTNVSEMYMYQREPDEESLRSSTHRSRVSDETGGICCGPSDRCKNGHRFPSSKTKNSKMNSEKHK